MKEILSAARIVTRIETGANSSVRGHFRKNDTLETRELQNFFEIFFLLVKVFRNFVKLFYYVLFFCFIGVIRWLTERFDSIRKELFLLSHS